MRVLVAGPGFVGDRLDGLYSRVALPAGVRQRVEVLRVILVLHGDVVVGEQDRVEVEALEAAAVRGGDLRAVPGDADATNKPLVPGFNSRFQHAAGTEGGIPLNRGGQAVQLPPVD